MGLGGAVASGIVTLPIYLLGGLSAMFDSAFIYNIYYASTNTFNVQYLWHVLLYLALPTLLLVWMLSQRIRYGVLWALITAAALFGTAGSTMTHYYLILIPPLAVVGSVGILALGKKLALLGAARESFFVYGGLVVMVLLVLAPEYSRFTLPPTKMAHFIYPQFFSAEALRMGQALAANTVPEDRVFIYGNEPEILYYANRRSANRFVIMYPLTIETPRQDAYLAEASVLLAKDPPEALVTPGYPGARHKSEKVDPYRTVTFAGHTYGFVGRVIDHYDGGFSYTTVSPVGIYDVGTTAFTLYKRLPDYSETARSTSSIEVMPRAAL
jgi:hypothetical protein